jgi:hypothetical protein
MPPHIFNLLGLRTTDIRSPLHSCRPVVRYLILPTMSALPPSDETAAMITGDRANFVGALIECGLYGTRYPALSATRMRADVPARHPRDPHWALRQLPPRGHGAPPDALDDHDDLRPDVLHTGHARVHRQLDHGRPDVRRVPLPGRAVRVPRHVLLHARERHERRRVLHWRLPRRRPAPLPRVDGVEQQLLRHRLPRVPLVRRLRCVAHSRERRARADERAPQLCR